MNTQIEYRNTQSWENRKRKNGKENT